MSINPTEYTMSLLPYSNLRYDRLNPRLYPDEQYEDPIELATHLLEIYTGAHTESYIDCIDNTALRPYIVVKEDEENVYTVLDGNIRLAVIQLTVDKALRKKVRMNKKPALAKVNEHFLWCAVFPDRQTAMPHVIRSGTNNNSRTWSLDGWARLMKDALVQGYTLDDVAKFSEYRVDGLARLLESHNAFNQLNRIHNDRWSGAYRTSYMREALDKYYIRQAIGLPEKPGTVDNLDPLPQTKKYKPVQIELMNWLFGSGKESASTTREFKISNSDEIKHLNKIYEDPECLEAFRQRNWSFYTVKSFLDDYNKTPSLNQITDQIGKLRYYADMYFDRARKAANLDRNEYNLIKITNVVYSVDELDNKLFTVELASKFPERHAPIATALEENLREVTANCVVRFW